MPCISWAIAGQKLDKAAQLSLQISGFSRMSYDMRLSLRLSGGQSALYYRAQDYSWAIVLRNFIFCAYRGRCWTHCGAEYGVSGGARLRNASRQALSYRIIAMSDFRWWSYDGLTKFQNYSFDCLTYPNITQLAGLFVRRWSWRSRASKAGEFHRRLFT